MTEERNAQPIVTAPQGFHSTADAKWQKARRRQKLTRWVAAVMVVAVWWGHFLPSRLAEDVNAVCRVDIAAWYELVTPSADTLRLSPRSLRFTTADGRLFTTDSLRSGGLYVSGQGHVVAPAETFDRWAAVPTADSLQRILAGELERLKAESVRLKDLQRELAYYAATHSVVDDGYNEVMARKAETDSMGQLTDSLIDRVKALQDARSTRAQLKFDITVSHAVTIPDTKSGQTALGIITASGRLITHNTNLLLIETDGLPAGADFVALSPRFGGRADGGRAVTVTAALDETKQVVAIDAATAHELDRAALTGGCVAGRGGCFGAMLTESDTVAAAQIRQFVGAALGYWHWWWLDAQTTFKRTLTLTDDGPARSQVGHLQTGHNLASRYRAAGTLTTRTDSLGRYAGFMAQGRPEGYGTMRYADGSAYTGEWHNGRRQGHGMLTDSSRTTYAGTWQADTLTVGTMTTIDGGVYQGRFDSSLRPSGHGQWRDNTGTYEGEWLAGRRNGFGFAITQGAIVKAGVWRDDKFRGEQMIYTADRVYGIDISRHQHEIKKKIHPIVWDQLRIADIDHAGGRRINGTQDYPVSFVYIKATEGTTIVNRYYAADAAAARRRSLPVGAYHFFSTRSGGAAQARHFIAKARMQRGDMAPVLDVEPTDRQIAAMGGPEVLFREMAAWVRMVKVASGTQPVLYLSQSFIDKYMANAPKTLTECPVWIARYSAFKPYVHLLHWQLSPRGRVRGITGDVDINVYNGKREGFIEYVKQSGVK